MPVKPPTLDDFVRVEEQAADQLMERGTIIAKIPREELERQAREKYAKVYNSPAADPRGASPVANVENAMHLADPEVLEFRGRRFLVPPISALDGFRLMHLSAELEAASQKVVGIEAFGRFVSAYRAVLKEIGRLARPTGWRGWFWSFRPNPFRKATTQEVQEILGFIGRCQTKSAVRHRLIEADGSRPSTS